MKKYIRSVTLSGGVLLLGATFGCQNPATNNANANVSVNANKTINVDKPPVANENKTSVEPAADSPSTGSLATPTDAYKTAYDMRKRKDVAGLKKVMSKDVLEFFTEMGKSEKKSLDDMLKEMAEQPQGPSNETRNEKITGDKAVLEYKTEKNEWKEMDFEKEGADWKMTLPKASGPGSEPKKP